MRRSPPLHSKKLRSSRRAAVILVIGFATQVVLLVSLFDRSGSGNDLPSPIYDSVTVDARLPAPNAGAAPIGGPYSISFERSLIPKFSSPPHYIPGLECVQVVGRSGLQSKEGVGAVFRLNQFAAFLASYYNVSLGFPSRHSEHSYDISSIFSDCGYVHTYMNFPSECVLNQANVIMHVCPRSDCECYASQFHDIMTDLVRDRSCSVVGVLVDRFKTTEFSGCIRPLLLRYFGTPPEAGHPYWEYDVVHYRLGDLQDKPGGKSFAPFQLEHLITALCEISSRDIIVITEGAPKLPMCGGSGTRSRIVIANSSMHDAFRIMQHAHFVTAGLSGFGYLLTEIADPERMVMLDCNVRFYRWVNCEKWTVVTNTGARFNFASKDHMQLYVMSSTQFTRERFLNPGDMKLRKVNWTLATRVWSPNMMTPLKITSEINGRRFIHSQQTSRKD